MAELFRAELQTIGVPPEVAPHHPLPHYPDPPANADRTRTEVQARAAPKPARRSPVHRHEPAPRVSFSPARRRKLLDRFAKLGEDLGALILDILDPAPEQDPAEPFSAASLNITDPKYTHVVDVRDRLIKARPKGVR